MKPLRRSIPTIVYPILLAAGVAGILLTRRDEETGPGKLPEDSSGRQQETLQAEVAAAQDPELDRFYQAAGYAPVWQDRRPEVIAALMAAADRGLKPADYLQAQTDVGLTRGLMQYAAHARYGRANPGTYDRAARIPMGELALTITHDPVGLEAGLRKLDPPFAEYKRLQAALTTASPENRLRIEQTMERWRWLPRSFPNGAILVNVPEYRLRAYDPSNNVVLDMRVVVGKTKQPTPLFTADLKYLIFAPYWNVPASIQAHEIIHDIEKNRKYLANNAYEVVNAQAEVVSTGEVSNEVLAGLRSGALRVRQVPGPNNSLGRVKFLFPNQEDVYLHDTPARELFTREQRTFSHGCVRVENPQALAEWVLRNEPGWSKERIEASLKLTAPLQANLKQPIPVFMVYHTVTVSDDGVPHFWKDVYKLEATTAVPAPRPRE
jgi:murein L,D-transpeptidase YcbB/YkuD